MDELSYSYDLLNGQRSNRLNHVNDITTPAYTGSDDIENQDLNNYKYDKLGQLLGDEQEGVLYYWRIGDKKLERMVNMNPTAYPQKPDVEYRYNPFGQRVLKVVKTRENGVVRPQEEWKYYYYSYDANGQVMALYEVQLSNTQNTATLSEQHIYGASRLGMVKQDALLYDSGNELEEQGELVVNILGARRYEITNYLGNVNAVITDRKVYASPGALTVYEAVVVLKADYYPFGMTMPGRHESGEGYRFGYNGMEINPEVSGDGNSYTTEFRQYDPRLGRWLRLDPLMAMFPWMSPYVAFDNNPVFYVDPLGLSATNGGDKGKGKKKRSDKLYDNAEKSANKWIKHNEKKNKINKGAYIEKDPNSGNVKVHYTKKVKEGEISVGLALFRQKPKVKYIFRGFVSQLRAFEDWLEGDTKFIDNKWVGDDYDKKEGGIDWRTKNDDYSYDDFKNFYSPNARVEYLPGLPGSLGGSAKPGTPLNKYKQKPSDFPEIEKIKSTLEQGSDHVVTRTVKAGEDAYGKTYVPNSKEIIIKVWYLSEDGYQAHAKFVNFPSLQEAKDKYSNLTFNKNENIYEGGAIPKK